MQFMGASVTVIKQRVTAINNDVTFIQIGDQLLNKGIYHRSRFHH